MAWAQAVARRTIGEVLPVALRAVGLEAEAARCEREPTADVAWAAAVAAAEEAASPAAEEAARAAAEAARAAAVAAARAAAWAAAEEARMGARMAARAADSDAILQLACRIWIEAAQEVAA